jgi:type II secretory pathway pseudopilin PulG
MKHFFPNSSAESGFTILEAMIATVVISTLAATAAPNWSNFANGQRLKEANEKIDASLRLTQARTRQESQSYSVQLRMSNNIPQMTTFRGSILPTSPAWVNLTERANLITLSLTQGDRVTFNIDGSIAQASPLSSNEKVTLSLTGTSNTRRECVIFRTLLGAMERGNRDSDCAQP